MRAAERLFAEQGVDGAPPRTSPSAPDEANSSALHYHFGSRAGLRRAIMDAHQERVEAALAARLADADASDLTSLVRAYVEAEASELAHDSGRDCLRIVGQVAHGTGFRDGQAHEALAGGALWGLFTRVAVLLVAAGCPTRSPTSASS
ncbi:hypothetical protein ACU686_22950 [Yinghuangia aomiensis]